MGSILLTLQFVLAVILVIAVLLQKSQSMGLGAYSGSNESLFGAKGPAGFLAKFTFVLGLVFVVNTLALGYIYNQSLRTSVVGTEAFEKSIVPSNLPAAPTATPTAPAAASDSAKPAASSDSANTPAASVETTPADKPAASVETTQAEKPASSDSANAPADKPAAPAQPATTK